MGLQDNIVFNSQLLRKTVWPQDNIVFNSQPNCVAHPHLGLEMEANARGLRYPHPENRYWNNSVRQNENLPQPHYSTESSYLHPIPDGSILDPPALNRDSQNSNTSYMKVIDSAEVSVNMRFFTCHSR